MKLGPVDIQMWDVQPEFSLLLATKFQLYCLWEFVSSSRQYRYSNQGSEKHLNSQGLQKHLNSSFPIRQTASQICLPWASLKCSLIYWCEQGLF